MYQRIAQDYLGTGVMVAVQRVAHQLPPRRAAHDAFKKATILRAEGGQLQAPVGPPRPIRVPALPGFCAAADWSLIFTCQTLHIQ